MEISILSRHSISPSQPTQQPHLLFLSAFDLQLCGKPHFQRILFYSHTPTHSSDTIASHLRHSLSLALTSFYPFAGRFTSSEGDDGRIEIDCNDAGVDFVEASANFAMHELGDFWTTDHMIDQLMRAPFCGFHESLLWIQVTTFSCGGFTISLSFHHSVADGESFWHFMKSWAELCRGYNHISSLPSHCRQILDVVPHHEKLPVVSKMSKLEINPSVVSLPSIQSFAFHVPRNSLTRLKGLANHAVENDDGSELTSHVTTFEALCGHFWQCVTRARMLPEDAITRFCVPVNCRRRLKQPAVPETYFGNMIHGAYACAKAGDVMRKSLRYAAGLLQEKIVERDEAFVRRWVEEAERKRSYEWPRLLETEMLVGSSPRFPVYGADFGWGKPCVARVIFWSEGCMVVDPSQDDDGSVCVSIALPSTVGERLLADPKFLFSTQFDHLP